MPRRSAGFRVRRQPLAAERGATSGRVLDSATAADEESSHSGGRRMLSTERRQHDQKRPAAAVMIPRREGESMRRTSQVRRARNTMAGFLAAALLAAIGQP